MRRVIMTGFDTKDEKAGSNLSWRAIFAGLVTFVATSILFALIGAAIGFGVLDLTSSNPFDGVGTGLIVWTVIAFVLSTALSGFVAGLTANRAGFIHGFLNWAVNTIAVFALVMAAASGAFTVAGNVASGAANVAGSVVQTAGQAVGGLTQEAFDAVSGSIDVDTQELQDTVTSVLEDTEVPELQPEYLQGAVDATLDDISTAAYNVLVGGNDAATEVEKVASNITDRVNNIATEVDRDAITTAVANNTELSEAEVDQAVDNIVVAYEETSTQVRQELEQAATEISQLADQATTAVSETVSETVDSALETGESITNSISNYAIWIFLGLLLGAVISAFAGYGGALTAIEVEDPAK